MRINSEAKEKKKATFLEEWCKKKWIKSGNIELWGDNAIKDQNEYKSG